MAVLECKNLKKTDTFGSTDGYVEVSLLPHKEKMDKTKTIKSSANPVWNQTFTYQVNTRASNADWRRYHNPEKGPYYRAYSPAFSWLKVPTYVFTFKTLLRLSHYAKQALTHGK